MSNNTKPSDSSDGGKGKRHENKKWHKLNRGEFEDEFDDYF